MELIRLEQIRKTYLLGDVDIHVLQGLSLRIDRGELVALFVPSHLGRTSLLTILGCLEQPTAGAYWLDGEEVAQLSGDEQALLRNKKIGFVFQDFHLLPAFSLVENVMMPLWYSGRCVSKEECRERALALLAWVGLEARHEEEPAALSPGEQQRVGIARALANDPLLLIAEEPTGNLDAAGGAEVLDLLRRVHARGDITVLLVTEMESIAALAQRTIHIERGQVEPPASATSPGADERIFVAGNIRLPGR